MPIRAFMQSKPEAGSVSEAWQELLSLSPCSRLRITSPAQVEVDSLPAVVSCGEHAYALDFLFWPFSLHDSIYFLTVRGFLHPARRPHFCT
jgi:hypothetical protein